MHMRSAEDTSELARQLGSVLTAGDCILLDGPIGSGKTHFARQLIQHVMGVAEDVPSPTYTLVQTYDTARGEIWHADLYRLTSADEIEELGLIEAFETAVCLIEWPDRLADLRPETALQIEFRSDPDIPDGRDLIFSSHAAKWQKLLDGLA